MKLEIINKSILKISFKSEELEENGISTCSFLANTNLAKPILEAAIQIANEELNFNLKKNYIISDTYSFNNTLFIIYITKISDKSIEKSNYNDEFLFIFHCLDEVISFTQRLSSFLKTTTINISFYTYDKLFFLLINTHNLPLEQTKKMQISFLDEETSYFTSNILISKIKEFNEPILSNISIKEFPKYF